MLRAVIKFSNQFKTCSGQHEGFRSYLFVVVVVMKRAQNVKLDVMVFSLLGG